MKEKQQPTVIKLEDFIKDMDSAFDTGIVLYLGDANNRTIVEIDETKNLIKPENKDYRNTIVFQNVTFRSSKKVTYSKIFELYCDCHFVNCKFETDMEFRTERLLVLENCTTNSNIDICGGNPNLQNCDFHTSRISFKYCNNIVVGDSKFFGCHFIDFAEAYVTMRRCEITDDVYVEESHFMSFCFQGGKLKNFLFKDCHIHSLDLSDLVSSKTIDLKVNQIIIRSTFIDHAMFLSNHIKEIIIRSSMLNRSVCYDTKIPKISSQRSVGFIPTQQHLTLYKKAKVVEVHKDDRKRIDEVIVKLEVPDDAKRVYCDYGKIRVSKAVTVGFYKLNGKQYNLKTNRGHIVISQYGSDYEYVIGKTQKPVEAFDPTYGRCGSGIHGFESFQDAVDYII